MSKISTYANSSPVLLTDKMIGTNTAGTPANATKNFLVSDLLSLFQSNITLQNVLDAGNTATQSITLTGAITQTGDFGITGNITQSGNLNVTGAITHVGAYNFSAGQFFMAATGTMVLGGAFTANAAVEMSAAVKLSGLSVFADNAAAVAGGLAVNTVYKTAAGELRIVV